MSSILATRAAARLAVLATFDLRGLCGEDSEFLEELIHSSHALEVERPEGGAGYMLTEAARVEAWAAVLRERGHGGLSSARDETERHSDTALQGVLDDYIYERDVDIEERNEDQLSAMLHVCRWASDAHSLAKVPEGRRALHRDEIEGRLRLLHVLRPVRRLLTGTFVGREDELERLHTFRNSVPSSAGLYSAPAMVIWGVGGMGKSTLVAKFLQEVVEESAGGAQAWAYLDFDRATLKPRSRAANGYRRAMAKTPSQLVLEDVVEQIGAQFPGVGRSLEEAYRGALEKTRADGLEALRPAGEAVEPATAVGDALNRAVGAEPVTVVLDTFEEVERHGGEVAEELFRMFDKLSHALPSLRLIVSGRAPAMAFYSSGELQLRVGEFGRTAAREVLSYFATGIVASETTGTTGTTETPAVDGNTAELVADLVGRSPLTLALAGRVLRAEGLGAIKDAARRADTLGKIRREFVRGFLYHRILDHVIPKDPEIDGGHLRAVARGAIVLRRVDEDVIAAVLLPAVGVKSDPSRYFEALSTEVALVLSVDDGKLQLRPELRRPALDALELDDAAFVRLIRTNAATYFEERGDLAESGYFRLANGHSTLDFSEDDLAKVRDLLSGDYGDFSKTTAGRLGELDRPGAAPAAALDVAREQLRWERQAHSEADAALLANDPKHAEKVLQARVERSESTSLYQLLSRIAEQRGELLQAIEFQNKDLLASIASVDALRVAAAGVRLAMLLEWNGDAEEAMNTFAELSGLELLRGEWALSLEVVLNQIAAGERLEAFTDDERWELELDARAFLGRITEGARHRPAMVRLVAAVFGRREHHHVRDAVRTIGLDGEAPRSRVQTLADRVVAWGRWFDPKTEYSRVAEALRGPSFAVPDAGVRWARYLSGLGDGASSVFGESFWELNPPRPVVDALRQFFLYAGFDRPTHLGSPPSAAKHADLGALEPAAEEEHFLDRPLDFTDKSAAEFESILRAAYKDQSELHSLIARIGLDQGEIDWGTRSRHVVRQILQLAQDRQLLAKLAAVVLDDAGDDMSIALRSLIGRGWLERRGLLGGGVALARGYARWYQQAAGHQAAWPPLSTTLAPGDYGKLRQGVFERLGNIGELGVDFATGTKEGVEVRYGSARQTGKTFTLDEGMLVRANGVRHEELGSIRDVADSVRRLKSDSRRLWRLGWSIVQRVYTCDVGIAIVPAGSVESVTASGELNAIRDFAEGGVPDTLTFDVGGIDSLAVTGAGQLGFDAFRLGLRGSIRS